ncbi:MAG: hypothetical protein ACRD7E_17820 [Bryobacteraceae bacterium]
MDLTGTDQLDASQLDTSDASRYARPFVPVPSFLHLNDPFPFEPPPRRSLLSIFLGLFLAAISAGVLYATPIALKWLVPNQPAVVRFLPQPDLREGSLALRLPGDALVAEVLRMEEELRAYLRFEYLRSVSYLRGHAEMGRVLLTARETGIAPPVYSMYIHLGNDLLQDLALLARLEADAYIPAYRLESGTAEMMKEKRQQSRLFVAAYQEPVRDRLEDLRLDDLLGPAKQFILFKSHTDRRVRERMEPLPETLSQDQAAALAADIITVAQFYNLPLDFFFGIAAIENNYMNVRGDVEHSVWKRRPEKGDIIVRRGRRGWVLVKNYSSGVWQITRETLRYCHKLYLDDTRDYSLLPQRLRPPEKLNLDEVEPTVLTTYAGLLFRDLLDHFEGDVQKAVGAYNGGTDSPNLNYEAHVRRAADYVRRVLEQTAALKNRALSQTRFRTEPQPVEEQGLVVPPSTPE